MTSAEAYMLRDAAIAERMTANVSQTDRLTGFILALELVLGLPSKIPTERIAHACVVDVMRGTAQEWAEKNK